MAQPKRYLVVFRVPQPGESYWCEGAIRTAGGPKWTDDESDEQPVIITDAAELKLLVSAIEMRDLLDDMLATGALSDATDRPTCEAARTLIRRFDEWEPR